MAGLGYAVTPSKTLDVDLDPIRSTRTNRGDREPAAVLGGREHRVFCNRFDSIRSLRRRRGGPLMAMRMPMIGLILAAGSSPCRGGAGRPRCDRPHQRPPRRDSVAAQPARLSSPVARDASERARNSTGPADEDAITRQRLFGVMHRYAGWLARLTRRGPPRSTMRPRGPDRLQLVRSTLDRQWLAGLTNDAARNLRATADRARLPCSTSGKPKSANAVCARAEALRGSGVRAAGRARISRASAPSGVRDTLEPNLSNARTERFDRGVATSAVVSLGFNNVAAMSNKRGMKPPRPTRVLEASPGPGKPRPPMIAVE